MSLINPIWLAQGRQWARLGPPLRPSPEDVARAELVVGAHRWGRGRALLLGVTPELATMRWPARTSLMAVDRSEAMIATVWPKPEGAEVVCADWRALPLGNASIDVIVGDGAVNVITPIADYVSLTSELRRVLVDGGLVHLRTFVAPDMGEPLDAVAADLERGQIRGFHALKWRIAMAVFARSGAVLDDVWKAFRALCPDDGALAERLGCDREIVETIHTYRGSTSVYSFPTLTELRAAFAPSFVERSIFVPSYELGERCPSIAFEVRS